MTTCVVPRPVWIARFLLVFLTAACGLPRDPEHTLDHVRGHELRVGVTDRPPWVEVHDDRVGGIEPSLISDLARQLGARPIFRKGSESELLDALHRGELDLVAGGLHDDSPWGAKAALTKPYHTDGTGVKHVLALRAGENAWLMEVERYLHRQRPPVSPVPSTGRGAGR
jgi:membrane-bound lytic murein transglycosylase MltF